MAISIVKFHTPQTNQFCVTIRLWFEKIDTFIVQRLGAHVINLFTLIHVKRGNKFSDSVKSVNRAYSTTHFRIQFGFHLYIYFIRFRK